MKCLAVVLRPESKENGSVVAYGGLELALGGAIGGGAQGGAAGVLKWFGKATGEANLRGAGSSSELECRGEKKFSTAARGFILATLNWQRMRTSG